VSSTLDRICNAALDVAVKNGKILEVSPDISPLPGRASVVSAKGKIVTPGLVDAHVHVFEGMGPIPCEWPISTVWCAALLRQLTRARQATRALPPSR